MLRVVMGFAAGFVAAKYATESGSLKKIATVAKEKGEQIKAASTKAVNAAKEEWNEIADKNAKTGKIEQKSKG